MKKKVKTVTSLLARAVIVLKIFRCRRNINASAGDRTITIVPNSGGVLLFQHALKSGRVLTIIGNRGFSTTGRCSHPI